ncbi:MAG: pectinesterase family protein, partial [Nitrospira sp.]|nr:pectinesterase family protein [Nitrospira sp.]
GGDYTSVSAALAAISPTAYDPYVIDVMPGVYTDHIDMKSYVHLRGAGREVTTIQAVYSYSDVITMSGLTNVAISGLSLSGGGVGIYNSASSWVTISDNSFFSNTVYGLWNTNSVTSITISGNRFVWNYHGIYNYYSFANISGNWISDSTHYGILNEYSSPLINGNTILWNTDYGIFNTQYSNPEIIHNHITGNGTADIFVAFTCAPNISFNTYDDITGTTGVGMYNVNGGGGPAPDP